MAQTMTISKMDELLQFSESSTCDFKWEIYRVEREESRISFLKDILSMANTIRDESAYIIVGVKQDNGKIELQNVNAMVDENQFLTFIKSTIGPCFPDFSYYTMQYKKHILGIFEIGVSRSGPYYSLKDFGEKVKKEKVYYRYSSSNTEADDKMIAEISAWMKDMPSDKYNGILEQMEYFDTGKYNYVLFLGDGENLVDEQYTLLGKVKWSMIVDMSKRSESSGFYKKVQHILGQHISIHLMTAEGKENSEFYEGKTLLWFMAGGERGQDNASLTKREWRSKYFKKVSDILLQIENASIKGFVYVDLFSGDKSDFVENIIGIQESNPLFVKYISIKWAKEFGIEENCGYISVQGLYADIFQMFKELQGDSRNEADCFRLPGKYETEEFIDDISWLHEELQPLYKDVESLRIYDESGEKSFYEGGRISWDEMNPCIAVTREKYTKLVSQIESNLKRGDFNCIPIRLDYRAGAGATTVLRMVGWHFHEQYPVVFILKYSSTGTIERLKLIYEKTNKNQMLLIIDENSMDDQLINELKTKVLLEGIHAVILYSRRHLRGTVNYLSEQLNSSENKAFCKLYTAQADKLQIDEVRKENRKYAISKLKDGEMVEKTPFMYALTTYEEGFTKLSDYVSNHLSEMNEEQENIFKIISVIQYYTGCMVPVTIVESELTNITGRLKVRNKLTDLQRSLLIFEDKNIRVIHHCVAEEILKYLCSKGLVNKEVWRNNLKDVLSYIITVLKKFSNNTIVNEIIKLLFLQQSCDEKKHFSDAIEELKESSAKKRLLFELEETFPDNAYVYSNIARFFYYLEKNEESGLEKIDKAINLLEDYTFYHIKGLLLSRQFGKFIEESADKIIENYSDFIERVDEYRDSVISAYDKSIELKYDNSYAYSAKINFYFDIIRKFHKYVYPKKKTEELFQNEKFYWCIRFLKEIQDTLNEMRIVNEYTGLEMDTENYENQLLTLHGDIPEAIQGWHNLLAKKDVYHPIIRQNLVDGYFVLCNYDWKTLSKQKLDSVQTLLQQNIIEERDNAKNILQWFNFSRYFEGNLSRAVEYFESEVSNPTLQYYFYGMIVFMIYGIEMKDISSIQMAEKYGKKCENYARNIPYRTKVMELYNPSKKDICAIEKYKDLQKNQEKFDDILERVTSIEGRIDSIDKPEIGWVRLEGLGFRIKFNPSWNPDRIYRKDKDENRPVRFVLGFRHEGAFAYHVRDIK